MTEEQAGPEGLINWSAALEYAGGDEAFLPVLIETFLDEEAPKTMSEIRRAIDQRDAKQLRISAHRLKGSLRIFGSKVASDLAFQLEEMGKNDALGEAAPVLARLEPQMELVIVAMKARLGR